MSAAKQRQILAAGQRAPDFQLQSLENGGRTLHELLAKGPVLLAFFKSTCPVCQMTLPFLERIHQAKAPGSFGIYGVSQDDAETAREFNAEFEINFPVLRDTEEAGYPASNEYGISHVPSLFLISSNGTIAWSQDGFSKREFETLASQAGVELFRPDENVPEWKSG